LQLQVTTLAIGLHLQFYRQQSLLILLGWVLQLQLQLALSGLFAGIGADELTPGEPGVFYMDNI
jgi:hypothetical protein